MNRLKQWIAKWAGAMPAPVLPVKAQVAPVRGITARELDERLRAAPGNPLFEAVLLIIEEKILEEMGESMGREVADRDARYHLGGAEALERLRDDLKGREQKAREEREQEKPDSQ